jgi:hypothetical protein
LFPIDQDTNKTPKFNLFKSDAGKAEVFDYLATLDQSLASSIAISLQLDAKP